ncbi:MAG: RNA 2',3'-cyclic phosphodiesterase [Gammaproteobacteria bacterium]|nr:RNA 2',3'-cyclic phosphodiesterase [Gammaproteobacteria bacterium]
MNNDSEEQAKKIRIFFSVTPDDDALSRIVKLQKEYSDSKCRLIPPDNIHITLLFIGNVDPQLLDCIKSSADKVLQHSFKLKLNYVSQFKRSGILWLGNKEDNENITELYDTLYANVSNCSVTLEKRRFKPHLTLARKFYSHVSQNDIPPITTRVSQFHLMQTIPYNNSVKYQIIKTWHLN